MGMYQLYWLSISYLLIGAGLLLVDEYGGRFIILIRLRNAVKARFSLQLALVVSGILLAIGVFLFPIAPGPVLFGDFFPFLCMLTLVIYHTIQLISNRKQESSEQNDEQHFSPPGFSVPPEVPEEDMLKKTGSLIETNKRNLGFVILSAAVLHFLFPAAVLL